MEEAEIPGEVVVNGESSSPKDRTHVVKGKRTKRQRVQSPSIIGLTPATNSSSADKHNTNEYEYQDGLISEEDEDMEMVNCLILLARGQLGTSAHKQHIVNNHVGGHKFKGRELIEMASNVTGKAGYCIYECKTCNRTFPSFQALGGHRTSHKKPNNKSSSIAAAAADEKNLLFSSSDEELDGHCKKNTINSNKKKIGGVGNNSKVHKCAACGAEFTSGQALGGHMRRHRSSNASVGTNNAALALNPTATRKVLSLDLDLNLHPTTPEDNNHNNESKFAFASNQQLEQQRQEQSPNLVFSSGDLVDCHY